MKMPTLTKSLILKAMYGDSGINAMLDKECDFYGSLHAPGGLAWSTLVERQDELAKIGLRVPDTEAAAVLYRRGLASLRWAAFQQVDSDKNCWAIHAGEDALSFLTVHRDTGELRIRLPKGAVQNVAAYGHAIEKATGRFCVPVLRWTSDQEASDSRHWK
jgi:hypothetical protein